MGRLTARSGSHVATAVAVVGLGIAATSIASTVDAQGREPAPPRARLVETLRLGAEEHDFPAVRRFYVGPRGQIVVPITQDLQLRIHDSTGALLARIGRRGDGPGEFRSIGALGWKADTMTIVDGSLRRVTYIGPDGTVLRSTMHWMPARRFGERPEPGASFAERIRSFYPLVELGDGTQVAELNVELPADDRSGRQYRLDYLIARRSPAGDLNIIAHVPPFEDERWSTFLDGFGSSIPFALTPQTGVAPSGQRVAHLWTTHTSRTGGTFTVSAFRTTGDTLFVRTYPFVGVPIPAAARDSALAAVLPRPGQPTEGPADLPQRRQALIRQRMPPIYAGVEYLIVGLDGTVFVALRATADGTPVLMLDADTGDPVADFVLPPRVRLRQADRSTAWVTEMDEDGVADVVRYRIEGVPAMRRR